MWLIYALLASALAISLGFGQKASAQGVPADLLPTTIHSYELRKITDFERHYKGLGRSFSFYPIGQVNTVITVYVYDQNREQIPDGVKSDLLNQEFQKAKSDLFSYKPDAIQIGDDEDTQHEAITYKFAAFDLPDKWEPDFSLLHMTARGNFFVKVRSTMASDRNLNRSLHNQELFLRELSKELHTKLPLKSRN